MARLSRDELFHLGLDLQRARTLLLLAREAPRIEAEGGDMARICARLRALPGIGVWTIGAVRHFAFGDPSAVLLADWHVGRDVVFALTGELRGDDRRMVELLAEFPGQEGRVARLIGAAGIHHPRRGPGRAPNPLLR